MKEKLNERIEKVIVHTGKTKSAFAAQLNVSPAFVTQLCNGSKLPSDRTISDICRIFDINEDWLRSGEGEMQTPVSRDAAIAAFMGDVMKGEDEDFRRRLVAVLSKLDEEEWKLLEQMALKLVAESKKEDQA